MYSVLKTTLYFVYIRIIKEKPTCLIVSLARENSVPVEARETTDNVFVPLIDACYRRQQPVSDNAVQFIKRADGAR